MQSVCLCVRSLQFERRRFPVAHFWKNWYQLRLRQCVSVLVFQAFQLVEWLCHWRSELHSKYIDAFDGAKDIKVCQACVGGDIRLVLFYQGT